jgi:hypothetical protein
LSSFKVRRNWAGFGARKGRIATGSRQTGVIMALVFPQVAQSAAKHAGRRFRRDKPGFTPH